MEGLGDVHAPEDALVLLAKLMWVSYCKEFGPDKDGWNAVTRCIANAWYGFGVPELNGSGSKLGDKIGSGSSVVTSSVKFEDPRFGSQSLGDLISE